MRQICHCWQHILINQRGWNINRISPVTLQSHTWSERETVTGHSTFLRGKKKTIWAHFCFGTSVFGFRRSIILCRHSSVSFLARRMQPRRPVRRRLAFHSHLPGASKHVSEESTSTRPPCEKLPKCHCHECSVTKVLNRWSLSNHLPLFFLLIIKLRYYIDFCLYRKYNNSNNNNNGLDFHWIFFTQAHWKHLQWTHHSFTHTTYTLVVVSNMCSHSCPVGGRLTETWQPIRADHHRTFSLPQKEEKNKNKN